MGNIIDILNNLLPGWTEVSDGGMICSANENAGIIDNEIVSGLWFVIFNDGTPMIDGLDSRNDAIEAYLAVKFTAVKHNETR